MPDPILIVEYFMIICGLLFIIFEVFLNLNGIRDDTTNVFLNEWSKGKFFFIPFALGAIGGHLFLGTETALYPENIVPFIANDILEVLVLLVIIIICVIIGCNFNTKREKSKTFLTIMLILGVLYGHYFWSMNH